MALPNNKFLLILQMILKFFDIFLKMKDLTTSEAFLVSIYTKFFLFFGGPKVKHVFIKSGYLPFTTSIRSLVID